jgi:hypothetical protein
MSRQPVRRRALPPARRCSAAHMCSPSCRSAPGGHRLLAPWRCAGTHRAAPRLTFSPWATISMCAGFAG